MGFVVQMFCLPPNNCFNPVKCTLPRVPTAVLPKELLHRAEILFIEERDGSMLTSSRSAESHGHCT